MTHTGVLARTIVVGAVVSALFPAVGSAAVSALTQQRPDSSARRDSTAVRRDTLEAVVVRATRSPSGGTAAARSTVTRAELQKTNTGQDAPLALRATPSMISYSESGSGSGYSYVRLRGVDQSRLNITIDGVPLNDGEDQVLYFSNVPDFLNSISSVEIGRGVGASTFGSSSFAGSLNFQSVPLATTPRGGELQLAAGSFNTWRASIQGATGVTPGGFAAYGRFSRQGTEGYREHSGNDAWSAFGSAGWFRERDALKLTGFVGLSGTRLAYYDASEADLKVNRRVNPLSESEGDRFHQEMFSAQYSRSIAEGLDATLLLYRNSAAGAYDVSFGPAPGGGLTLANYGLFHVWHGATTALNWTTSDWLLSVGGTASDYHRDHWLAIRPNLDDREYTNTGVKREAAAFIKATRIAGRLRIGADVNVRYAHFLYEPSSNSGIHPQPVTWSLINPKLGATWDADANLSFFATAGRSWREPARSDLLAGADDINHENANDLIPLSQVTPEKVDDYEAGFTWRGASATLTGNLFAMEFHNEIAAIGQIALTGAPLRKNVPESYRRGVELEANTSLPRGGTVSGNFAFMRARIAEYDDKPAGVVYHDIEPVLTPPITANVRWDSPAARRLGFGLAARYIDRMHLANDGNDKLVVPAATVLDASIRGGRGAWNWVLEINNLLDADAYTSGYTDGTDRYLMPLATRNVMLTVRRKL
jgi:iron complex outermembrane receptor protein